MWLGDNHCILIQHCAGQRSTRLQDGTSELISSGATSLLFGPLVLLAVFGVISEQKINSSLERQCLNLSKAKGSF